MNDMLLFAIVVLGNAIFILFMVYVMFIYDIKEKKL